MIYGMMITMSECDGELTRKEPLWGSTRYGRYGTESWFETSPRGKFFETYITYVEGRRGASPPAFIDSYDCQEVERTRTLGNNPTVITRLFHSCFLGG